MPVDGDFSRQQATLEKLRDEMEQAKALYDSAKEAYERLRKELGHEGTEPESKFQRALDTRDFLMSLYAESLKRYDEYLLDNLGSEPRIRKAGSEPPTHTRA